MHVLPLSRLVQTLGLCLAFLAPAFTSARSQSIETIGKEFRQKASSACDKLTGTLKTQGTSIVKKLVSQGDTAAAQTVADQVDAKAKGQRVPEPHKEVSMLFNQYDMACKYAVTPIQDTYVKKLDAQLKRVDPKEMSQILAFAKLREEIVNWIPAAATPGSPASAMEAFFVDKSWFSGVGIEYHFDANGGGFRRAGSQKMPLTWKFSKDNDFVEAVSKMSPDLPDRPFNFRFHSPTEGEFVNIRDGVVEPGDKVVKSSKVP